MNFKGNNIYPKPEVVNPNIEYAKILLHDYAGEQGEDSAIHLYMFQSLILNKQHPKIANNLFHIAIVEMHHLKLLGETIKLLGLNPEYVTYQSDSNIKHFWSSSFISYDTNLKEILKTDIEKERNAINAYQSHYNLISDIYIKNLLLRIIEDEKIHLEYFTKQLYLLENKNMD